jgi:dihydroorotate dehydrogenase
MGWFYERFARPALFLADSERIHDRTLFGLGLASRSPALLRAGEGWLNPPVIPVEAMGLRFPNPFGLAAGMDKHARALPVWRAMGFGFSEMGGVTLHAQPGNPQPRMFRAIPEEALINRMGFNNPGADALAAALTRWRDGGLWPDHPVGVNLGKSKITPLADAASDYVGSLRSLWSCADFFVVNVSSPNTPNLRALQDRDALDAILSALEAENLAQAAARGGRPRPLLVKVAPDLSDEALDEVADLAAARRLAGVVAVNTTIARPFTRDPVASLVYRETGGLSGRPLHARAVEVVRRLYRRSKGGLMIIGVGGVGSADDAMRLACAGATLVQAYSGLVYKGPTWAAEVVSGLAERLGGRRWADIVGSAA